MGVMIEAGVVKEGTPICVPSREVRFVLTFMCSCISCDARTVQFATLDHHSISLTIIRRLSVECNDH
jgi:hypothetical protein